ncbi:MAG TPA: N-acetylmuramoyl-L-alanine amidase [Thermoanaerobaculia bacterium]
MKTTPILNLLLLGPLLLAAAPLGAQEGEEEDAPPEIHASEPAVLIFEGRPVTTVPFTVTPGGPCFHLRTMASVLGVELTVGPLGDSHRLVVRDKEVILGPDRAVAVVSQADGQQEILTFVQRPVRGVTGLLVPLDLLQRTLGQELGFEIAWDGEANALEVRRREARTLTVAVDVFHQHSSTVELRFSAVPRYRVERLPDALEIRLAGDRVELPVDVSRATSPLVRRVVVAADKVRIEPAAGAGVAEPRLIESPEPRLVVEVFYQTAARAPEEPDRALVEPAPGVRTIVIDPGHGGPETGAVGPSGTTEKELALAVGRSLKRLLERRMAVRVVLTRDGDQDLPLETRTAVANQNQADLFVSLHFNSYYGRQAHGAETYFLSREASDQVAAAAAATENLSAGEPDPELDLKLILWDLAQTYHLAESQRFASLVQEELNLTLGLRDRGVKQAPFLVLMGATMPAVLVELGFLSNPDEEAKLRSPIYQAELVDSLFRAIRRFKTQIEAQGEAAPPPGFDAAGGTGREGAGREAAGQDPPP